MGTKPKKRRKVSPITGKPYPKCKVKDCIDNVYADGKCYFHSQRRIVGVNSI